MISFKLAVKTFMQYIYVRRNLKDNYFAEFAKRDKSYRVQGKIN